MNLANVTHKSENIICQSDKFSYLKFFLIFLGKYHFADFTKSKVRQQLPNLKKQNQKTIARLKKFVTYLSDKH